MYVYKCYQSLQIWLNSTCASRLNWSGESALLTKVINSLFCSLIVTLMCSIHPTVLFLYPLKLFLMFSWAIKKDLRWAKGLIRVVAVLSKSRMTIMNLKEASLIIFYLYLCCFGRLKWHQLYLENVIREKFQTIKCIALTKKTFTCSNSTTIETLVKRMKYVQR